MKHVACPICQNKKTDIKYQGSIRKGKFPSHEKNKKIFQCPSCTTIFQEQTLNYEDNSYRNLTNGSNEIEKLKFLSNELDNQLRFLPKENFETKSVIDVGCATGFLLDYLKEKGAKTSAIEKNQVFIDFLCKSGHSTYSDFNQIREEKFDLVTCFNVIEHVEDAITFVKNMYEILKPGGTLLIETPNSNDYLLNILGEDFASFFYRVQHRFYFDEQSLKQVMIYSGVSDYTFLYSQKYGLKNLLNWVKKKLPGQMDEYEFSKGLEEQFQREIEMNKASDHIIIRIKKNV